MLSITGYVATVERLKTRERTMRGRRARVQAGHPLAGPKPPFGYRWLPDIRDVSGKVTTLKPGLEEDPSTSWIVQRIFAESAQGRGQAAIAAGLTRDGISTPTARSKKWGQSTIRCILINPMYAGQCIGFRVEVAKDERRDTRHKRVVRLRDMDQTIALPPSAAPPLVDPSVFEAVQARFSLNVERAARSNPEPEATLLRGGYVRCGYCGATMMVHRHRSRLSYRCSRRQRFKDACPGATIVSSMLDDVVWERIESLLLDPSTIRDELERLTVDDPTEADLAFVDQRIAQAKRRRSNLAANLGLLDADSAEVVRDQLATLSQQTRAFEAEREQVLTRHQARLDAAARLAELETWCSTVAANLGQLSYDQRRLALDALGVGVKVWKPDHTPRFQIEASIPLGSGDGQLAISTSRGNDRKYAVMLQWTDDQVTGPRSSSSATSRP